MLKADGADPEQERKAEWQHGACRRSGCVSTQQDE